MDRQQKKPQEW